ncbi:MAG: glycerophosphoryl diester phosphodiesterase [Cyclobacteriaceae bacterium]|nr:glycerophosphoryl diester phosphodiesterase [Cyclobacteriaceae bacterium]
MKELLVQKLYPVLGILFLLSCTTGHQEPDTIKTTEHFPSLGISSSALSLEWIQKPEGWTLNSITTDGVPVANPRGFFNILYTTKQYPARVYNDVAGKNSTFYPLKAVKLSDRSIQFKHSLPLAEIESIWEIDTEHPSDIKVSIKLTAKSDGHYSIASPTIAVIKEEELKWGMIPGNWYGTELENDLNLVRSYSQGIPTVPMLADERNSGTLCPLLTGSNNVTLAVIPEPGTSRDPWEKDAFSRANPRLGMSLMNRHNQFTPIVYFPILGQDGSKLESGQSILFNFRYSIQAKDWFTVFSHAVNNIYRLPSLLNLQENSFSLSERTYRMLNFLNDDKKSAWRTWEVSGYEVGATGNKNADAGTMGMILHAAKDTVMQKRMKYIRNFKLAQQQTEAGFFQGAALGEYGHKDGFESEEGNWIEPLFTTYYTMMDMGNMLLFDPDDQELRERLRLGAEKLMDWQHDDGSWDVGYDVFSNELAFPDLKDYRPTWYGLLIAYKILGDREYLDAAIKGADWLIAEGVNKGRYLGVCGDARNKWDFGTAQISQAYMDLFDITKKDTYREAGIEAARVYTTSIYTHPIATKNVKTVAGKERKDWEINQAGLGVEHIRGTGFRGPILLTSHVGLFVRIFEHTGDSVFLTMARAAARGRQAFVDEESGISIYYWDALENVERGARNFPWHAFWQIGWITDYLISEAGLRSSGEVEFPGGFMTPKVGPHRTYGFAPGTVYGQKADLIFRQGMIRCDNPDIEYITALSENKSTLYILAMNQSPKEGSGSFSIDISRLSPKAKWGKEKVLQGDVPEVKRSEGKMNVSIPAWGMNVVALEVME